ncbi:MAG: hypothetical protein IKD76_03115 [Clostridia bacterium]|nr:hypothetical protein [Clostridia bacterium]
MKLRWKDVYKNNKQRRYCEVVGIKKEDVEIESNSYKTLKERKSIVLVFSIVVALLLVWTFKSNIKILLMVLAFFVAIGIGFFVFNYFKFKCLRDGLYIKFGFQEGKFSYDKLKSVYLSKYNDYSFLIPNKRVYSIVIRYADNNGRIKELSFPNYFLKPEETEEFLNNFNIKENENNSYVQYERFKLLKRVGKVVFFVLFAMFVIGVTFFKQQ